MIEKAFRTTNEIRVLVATSTLAAGINTPVSVVIIVETEFVGGQPRPYTVAEYKNMAGRAGRLGYESEGFSILLSNHATQQNQIFSKYVLGNLEAIQSSFDPNDLDTWVMRLLSQVNQVPRSEVLHLLANTYGGYLGNLQHPDWRRDMERNIEQLLVKMIDLELIEEEMEAIQLTLLGRACGRSALSFRSAMRLVELLKLLPAGTLTAERLMVIVQTLSELDNTYTPLMRGNNPEVSVRHEVSVRYGDDIVKSLQKWVESPRAFSARCKRALVLSDWIAGKPLEQIETGLPAKIIPLLSLPFSLNRGEYLALKDQGITTVAKIKETNPEDLRNIIRPDRANYLIANL